MQDLLHVAGILHSRGYEYLRIIPSVSPSGMSWRCSFLYQDDSEQEEIIASNWFQDVTQKPHRTPTGPEQLADLFEKDHAAFLAKCKIPNPAYVRWFRELLDFLMPEELPYAFAEYFSPADFWKTSKGRRFSILPGEKDYCRD